MRMPVLSIPKRFRAGVAWKYRYHRIRDWSPLVTFLRRVAYSKKVTGGNSRFLQPAG